MQWAFISKSGLTYYKNSQSYTPPYLLLGTETVLYLNEKIKKDIIAD